MRFKLVAVAELAPSGTSPSPGVQALDRFNAGEWSIAIDLADLQLKSIYQVHEIRAEMPY